MDKSCKIFPPFNHNNFTWDKKKYMTKYKKNKIDTLILSGGGVRCLSFIGAMENLFTNHILSRDLQGIKRIISLSGGSLFILPFILKIPLTEIKQFRAPIWRSNFKKVPV